MIDNTSSFPVGWKATDTFHLIAYNSPDTLGNFSTIAPLGTEVDAHFGTMRSSFYTNFQTQLSSKQFAYSVVDSICLYMPVFKDKPMYGKPSALDIQVYEMTEAFDTTITNKKISYSYNSTSLGGVTNYSVNSSDSITDGSKKLAPGIKIKLSNTLANKIIAGGPYADDAAFQKVLKGLYIRSNSNSTNNGFAIVSTANDQKLKIYGRNSLDSQLQSEFIISTNSTTSNEYLHDASSPASLASRSPNKTSGDNLLYNHGLYGYYNILDLPDLKNFSGTKNIFKAELSLFVIDTNIESAPILGLSYKNSVNQEVSLYDNAYGQNYFIAARDTIINGVYAKEYRFNIGMQINEIISKNLSKQLRIYSYRLDTRNGTTTKVSNYYPSRAVIAGSTHPLKPKLKIYFIDK